MQVDNIPIPAAASIKVSKEGKSAIFQTTIIQTTDNKYIYTLPIHVDKKLINFELKGSTAPFEFYAWKNISIIKFVEDGKTYLRIKTTAHGIKSLPWPDKPLNITENKRIIDQGVIDNIIKDKQAPKSPQQPQVSVQP